MYVGSYVMEDVQITCSRGGGTKRAHLLVIIGVSRSEPHTSDVNRDFSIYMYIYIYIYLPYVSSNYTHYLKIALTTFTNSQN